MNAIRIYLLAAILGVPLVTEAQSPGGYSPGTAPGQAVTMPNASPVGDVASSSALKILSPKADENVASSAVTVNYELLNGAVSAAGSPIYRLQLDSRDPVETTSTEYSFTGLRSGNHVLTVGLVDANHTPIMGSNTEVRFSSGNQASTGTQQAPVQPQSQPAQPQQQQPPRADLQPPTIHKARLPLPPSSGSDELPSAGGELPLLSMVGFGVLAGGLISAMRTRR